MVKHYYEFLQQVYSIINIKISGIKPKLALQIFFKAINNLMIFNRLIFTLSVFSTYYRLTELDA